MDFDYTPEQERLRKDYRARLEAVMTPERRASVATPTEGGRPSPIADAPLARPAFSASRGRPSTAGAA